MATNNDKNKKITETGPVGLKGIRNTDLYKLAQSGDPDAITVLQGASNEGFGPFDPRHHNVKAYYTPQQHQPGTAYADLGNSSYDDPFILGSNEDDVNERRYENQPWTHVLANGIGKLFGTAATTFLSSLIGVPYGLVSAFSGNGASALWDNDFTKAMADVDNWFKDNLKSYKSKEQQEAKWYDPVNLLSMNFIAEDFLANTGFTLGAAASMAVGTGAMGLVSKALGFVDKASKAGNGVRNFLSALGAATGEGMIEARNGVEERNKMEMQRLNDALAGEEQSLRDEYAAIDAEYSANKGKSLVRGGDGSVIDPAYATYVQRMENLQKKRDAFEMKRAAGIQQIEDSGKLMGNKILLANQGLLTMGNLIQFGRAMTKSYDSARHAVETTIKSKLPSGARVVGNAETGYNLVGKNWGRTKALTKGLITEGSEEMNQEWISQSAGYAHNEQEIDDYWRAKLDPESYRKNTKALYDLGSVLSAGFNKSWWDFDQWQQFLIGGITGMAGSYSPTKIFNQDKTKSKWNPFRYGSWEGGIVNELPEFNRQYNQMQQNVDELNEVVSSGFKNRVSSFAAHTYLESQKTAKAEEDDKKGWKDADDKQLIHDIQAFVRAGKVDDLRAIYNSAGLSDEAVAEVVKRTTQHTTKEENKQIFDSEIDEQIADKHKKKDALQARISKHEDALANGNMSLKQHKNKKNYISKLKKQARALDDEIADLNKQKEEYEPVDVYNGPYVDAQGNQTKSNDEIREILQHNSQALNDRLDSYLESVAAVNEATGGNLTNEQEDHLAYLHNVGKEKRKRSVDIGKSIREKLPTKFLFRTNKTPEQLAKEQHLSKVVFSETEKEGYLEADTSTMSDAAFQRFLIRDILWGGNIASEFAETEDEKALREKEEQGLSEQEKREKRLARSKDRLDKLSEEARKQREENATLIAESLKEVNPDDMKSGIEALIDRLSVFQDIRDMEALEREAGEYQKVLNDYMTNPELSDKAREKVAKEAEEENKKEEQRSKFEGKTSQEISKDLQDGNTTREELDDFIGGTNISLEDLDDIQDEFTEARKEAKKAADKKDKVDALKGKINEVLGDNPTDIQQKAADALIENLNHAETTVENPEDINVDLEELFVPVVGEYDRPDVSLEELEAITKEAQQIFAKANNAYNEDMAIAEKLPDSLDDVTREFNEQRTSGKDDVPTVEADIVNPPVTTAPKTTITPDSIDSIIEATLNALKTNINGAWRSTTRKFRYGKSSGYYHDTIPNKNSKEYKRAKALWEYLNNEHAFGRQENSSADRIKPEQEVHFMVRYFSEVFDGRDFDSLTEQEKPYALAIIMLNEKGEVIGDLPLAELEPSFIQGNPNTEVQKLKGLQDLAFKAFSDNHAKTGATQAVVDSMKKEGADNLNLTFKNSSRPIIGKVDQVMRGVVPYTKNETNTLNDVAAGQSLELCVKVSRKDVVGGYTAATKKGDKVPHKEIILPNVGSEGQPYMLLPTPSGEKIAVPFYMRPFDVDKHSDTQLFKIIANSLYHLMRRSEDKQKNSESFKKHINVIEGLLQVFHDPSQHVITKDLKNNTITLHLLPLTSPENPIDITVPYSNDIAAVAVELTKKLSGIPINVSLDFLNDKIEVGVEDEKQVFTYNNVIGEIADVNLPKATNHTVAGWFTVSLEAGKRKNPIKPQDKIVRETIDGVNVEMNLTTGKITNTDTKDTFNNDKADLRIAELSARLPENIGKPYIFVVTNGTTRKYDTKNKKFVSKKEEGNTDNRTRSEKVIDQLLKDSKDFELTDANGNPNPNGNFYRNKKTGKLYARVTSVKEGDPNIEVFKEKDEKGNPNIWTLPSTTLGNAVDEFVRAFFADESLEGNPLYDNLSENSKKQLKTVLQNIKKQLEKEGWKVLSSGVKAYGTITVTDKIPGFTRDINVAGTLDLLLYNPNTNEYAIWDMKTHRSSYIDDKKKDGWAAQVSMYKQLLEQQYPEMRGRIKELKILPFTVQGYDPRAENYSTDSKKRLINGSGKVVVATVKYDGATINFEKEYPVNVNIGKPGFKEDYVKGVGAVAITTAVGRNGKSVTIPQDRVDKAENYLASNPMSSKDYWKLADMFDLPYGFAAELILKSAEEAAEGAEDARGRRGENNSAVKTSITIEEANKIATERGILNRGTKDAWNAIPEDIRIGLVSGNTAIELSYGNKKGIYKFNAKLEVALKEANMFAKSGNLKVQRAAVPMEKSVNSIIKEQERKAHQWISRNLPSLSKEERIQFVETLVRLGDNAWSNYRAGVIEIMRNAPEGAMYHESFHYVMDMLLSPKEKKDTLNAAREAYGEGLSNMEAEERLANDFRRYCLDNNATGIVGRIRRFFRNLMDKIRRYNRISDTTVLQLFWNINNGKLANKSLQIEKPEEKRQRIQTEIRSIQEERLSWKNLPASTKSVYKDVGLSEEDYERMSLEEKEQYKRCVS